VVKSQHRAVFLDKAHQVVAHGVKGRRDALGVYGGVYLRGGHGLGRRCQDVEDLLPRQAATATPTAPGLLRQCLLDLVRLDSQPAQLSLYDVQHLPKRFFGLLREEINDAADRRHAHRIHTATQKRQSLGTQAGSSCMLSGGPVAQRIERSLARRTVEGSSPSWAVSPFRGTRGP